MMLFSSKKRVAVLTAVVICLLALVCSYRPLNPVGHTDQASSDAVRLNDRFVKALNELGSTSNRVAVVAMLVHLREELTRAPRAESVRALRSFLESGQDANTSLSFKLNGDGSLLEAPTLRVFALNLLAELDRSAAANMATKILQSKTSADEWAVAMRAYAHGSSDAPQEIQTFLQAKAQEMVMYVPWQHNPSIGFLEAFDTFVYTQDTDFVPQLAAFVGDAGNVSVAHAAFLTLDRLVETVPAKTLQTLINQPDLLADKEQTEASYFARADMRDPAQKELLAQFLLSSGRSQTELVTFAGLFPNFNFMISNNLLTENPTLSNPELLSRIDSAGQTLAEWTAKPQFNGVLPQLQLIQKRLNVITATVSR